MGRKTKRSRRRRWRARLAQVRLPPWLFYLLAALFGGAIMVLMMWGMFSAPPVAE